MKNKLVKSEYYYLVYKDPINGDSSNFRVVSEVVFVKGIYSNKVIQADFLCVRNPSTGRSDRDSISAEIVNKLGEPGDRFILMNNETILEVFHIADIATGLDWYVEEKLITKKD